MASRSGTSPSTYRKADYDSLCIGVVKYPATCIVTPKLMLQYMHFAAKLMTQLQILREVPISDRETVHKVRSEVT